MFGDRAQGVLLAIAADHDDRGRVRARFAVGVFDVVVDAVKCRRRGGPHGAHQLQRFDHLLDANARGRKLVAIGAVLALQPAGAVAQDESPAAEGLQAGGHLGHQRRMAERVGQDDGAQHRARVAGRDPR